jgi:hypothetical protein
MFLKPNYYEKINQNKYNNEIYRIGSIADGSCAFHSTFMCLSEDYRKTTINERKTIVDTFRKRLSEKITQNDYLNYSNGELCIEDVTKRLRILVMDYLENGKKSKINHYAKKYMDYTVDIKLDPISFEKTYESCFTGKNLNIFTFQKNLYEKIENMSIFFDIALLKSYRKFVKSINSREWFNIRMLEILMESIKCNIYIFNDRDFSIVNTDKNIYKYDTNIMILWVSESHFEPLGVLNKEEIILSFKNTDDIIQNINNFFV